MYKLTDKQKENLKIIEKLTDVDYEINENNEVETDYYDEYVDKILMEANNE